LLGIFEASGTYECPRLSGQIIKTSIDFSNVTWVYSVGLLFDRLMSTGILMKERLKSLIGISDSVAYDGMSYKDHNFTLRKRKIAELENENLQVCTPEVDIYDYLPIDNTLLICKTKSKDGKESEQVCTLNGENPVSTSPIDFLGITKLINDLMSREMDRYPFKLARKIANGDIISNTSLVGASMSELVSGLKLPLDKHREHNTDTYSYYLSKMGKIEVSRWKHEEKVLYISSDQKIHSKFLSALNKNVVINYHTFKITDKDGLRLVSQTMLRHLSQEVSVYIGPWPSNLALNSMYHVKVCLSSNAYYRAQCEADRLLYLASSQNAKTGMENLREKLQGISNKSDRDISTLSNLEENLKSVKYRTTDDWGTMTGADRECVFLEILDGKLNLEDIKLYFTAYNARKLYINMIYSRNIVFDSESDSVNILHPSGRTLILSTDAYFFLIKGMPTDIQGKFLISTCTMGMQSTILCQITSATTLPQVRYYSPIEEVGSYGRVVMMIPRIKLSLVEGILKPILSRVPIECDKKMYRNASLRLLREDTSWEDLLIYVRILLQGKYYAEYGTMQVYKEDPDEALDIALGIYLIEGRLTTDLRKAEKLFSPNYQTDKPMESVAAFSTGHLKDIATGALATLLRFSGLSMTVEANLDAAKRITCQDNVREFIDSIRNELIAMRPEVIKPRRTLITYNCDSTYTEDRSKSTTNDTHSAPSWLVNVWGIAYKNVTAGSSLWAVKKVRHLSQPSIPFTPIKKTGKYPSSKAAKKITFKADSPIILSDDDDSSESDHDPVQKKSKGGRTLTQVHLSKTFKLQNKLTKDLKGFFKKIFNRRQRLS